MSKTNEMDVIYNAKISIEYAQHRYLKRHGWKYTCNIPGSFWLWRRDFGDVDAKRLSWWENANGPLGKPSKPEPYGVITATTDIAISMTQSELAGD